MTTTPLPSQAGGGKHVFDAWAGQDNEQLKATCRRLSRQHFADTAIIETMREALRELVEDAEHRGDGDTREVIAARAALAQASPPSKETV